MTSEIVKIFVGPSREEYNLHKALLCHRSSFFNAAFQSSFRESHEGVINFPEDSAEAFALFVPWIYGSPLSIDPHFKLHTYIEVYGLAQKFCTEDLCNQAMDRIKSFFKESGRLVEPDDVYWGYNLTSQGCGLRRFLSDSMAYRFLKPECGALPEPMLEDFVQSVVEIEDLARDFMVAQNTYRLRNFGMPCQEKSCYYHEHRQTPPCATTSAWY